MPATINNVKTDVVERRIVPMQNWVKLEDIGPQADTTTYPVLKGGISIGPCRSVFIDEADAECRGLPGAGNYLFVGTLGVPVRDRSTGDDMLLSNFHVMCVDNGWTAGDTIAQPSRVDGGSCPTDVVAELTRATLNSKVDAAVARRTARSSTCEIVDIGDVDGKTSATIGMAVRKRGRTTELTHGLVDVVNLTVNVPYCDGPGTVTLTNQIGIDVDTSQSTVFGQGGDSGSVVVDGSRRVVGLYFAGTPDGTYGIANHIDDVLAEMSVDLCVSKPPFKESKEFPKEFAPKEFGPKEKELGPKEFKELDPKEAKEKDAGPKEGKEFGPKEKERGPKEFKESPKEFGPKEFKEKEVGPEGPEFPRRPGGGDFDERLKRLEDAVSQLMHFIGSELRPDLRRGSLRGERDLQRQAEEAQQTKYLHDTGKHPER